MSFEGPVFVLAIIAMSTIGWIVTTAIRARHGYPVEGEWGGTVLRHDHSKQNELIAENKGLKADISRLEERLKVVERIVTDGGVQTAAQIEALRPERLTAQDEIN